MGCCAGKQAAGGTRMKRQASQHALFSSLALKFPLVRRAFRNIREAFVGEAGGAEEEISAAKLKDVMNALGAVTIDDQQCQELFALADLDGSQAISWREFMIAVGVGYYLKDDVPGEGPHYVENRRAFKVIQDAFRKIDKDDSGEIDAAELKKALFDVASSSESDNILENRFAELDVNSDKTVSFEEFLFGFISWVGMDEDEDDDDEEADSDLDGLETDRSLKRAENNTFHNRNSGVFGVSDEAGNDGGSGVPDGVEEEREEDGDYDDEQDEDSRSYEGGDEANADATVPQEAAAE